MGSVPGTSHSHGGTQRRERVPVEVEREMGRRALARARRRATQAPARLGSLWAIVYALAARSD